MNSVYETYKDVICVSLQGLIDHEWEHMKPNYRKDGSIRYDLWGKWNNLARKAKATRQIGGRGRKSLIEFDILPSKYQELLKEEFGNPKEAEHVSRLRKVATPDQEAARFFSTYIVKDPDITLPEKHQVQYTANAIVLNAIKVIYEQQKRSRAALGGSMKNFWKDMAKTVFAERAHFKHKLPKNHISLKRKYQEYHEVGYESLISGKFNNDNSNKITPEIENWMIKQMAETRQSIDMIYMRYHQEAEKRGWRQDITSYAFINRSKKKSIRQKVDLARHGKKKYRQLNGHYHKLSKPKYSNDIWYGDGTGTGWCYRTSGGAIGYATTYFVMDCLSGKFIGHSTREGINKESSDLQLLAFRDALRKTSYVRPYQVKLDHQKGHKKKETSTFLNQLAKHITYSRPYRSSGRDIERKFGQFQKMKLSEFFFWSGFGRHTHSTADHAPNRELMEQHLEELPTFEELTQLLEIVVEEWNNMNYKGRPSPNEIYADNADPEQETLELDQIADMFFNVQGPKRYGNTGIKLEHEGETTLYEVYDKNDDVDFQFRKSYLHSSMYLKYDPDREFKDIDLLIVHPTGGYQKVATASPKREVSESIRYHNEGDVSWALKQMDREEEYMEELEAELHEAGYSEKEKLSAWRKRIETREPVLAEVDDDEEDADKLFRNQL